MSAEPQQPDPGPGEGKNLTILEHLQEVRYRMMICAGALTITMIGSLIFLTNETLRWLKVPAENRVENFELVFTQPLEYWTTFFRVSLMLGITFAMPVFIW